MCTIWTQNCVVETTDNNFVRGAVVSASSYAGRILGRSSSGAVSSNRRHRTVAACADDVDGNGQDGESSEDTVNEKLGTLELENTSLRHKNITLNQLLLTANDKKMALDDAVKLVTNAINKELDDPATLLSQTASKQFTPGISAAHTDKAWLKTFPAVTKMVLSAIFPRKNVLSSSYRAVATTDHMSVDPNDSSNSSDFGDTPDDYDNDDEEDAGRKRWTATAGAALLKHHHPVDFKSEFARRTQNVIYDSTGSMLSINLHRGQLPGSYASRSIIEQRLQYAKEFHILRFNPADCNTPPAVGIVPTLKVSYRATSICFPDCADCVLLSTLL